MEEVLDKPTIQEIKMIIEMLKCGKAPGIDEILLECLKKVGNKLIQQIHKLILDIWDQEEILKSLRISSVLCPLYKKEDKMSPKN